ncbi:MAG: hypothetical protein IPG45_05985 [Deltaproteobacteria bacterium]|nr:hypothetical protein [Deltaproteobacteria bacterium]
MSSTAAIPTMMEGDFGRAVRVRVVADGEPVTLVGATTRQIILRRISPAGVTTRTLTAAFVTDGSDGLLSATPADATVLTPAGAWEIQARVAGTGFDWRTDWAPFAVKA